MGALALQITAYIHYIITFMASFKSEWEDLGADTGFKYPANQSYFVEILSPDNVIS